MRTTVWTLTVFCLISAASLLTTSAHAQILKGKVVDHHSRPIKDVYVLHLASEHHAHTNDFGLFLLGDVKVGDSIRVMHMGFQFQTLVIDSLDKELLILLEEDEFELGQVSVSQSIKTLKRIAEIDLKVTPVGSPQEVLRVMPGLFIGQHAGGGKAEQIFLRGFDIDHGTDISITVDGMPVNMVSHAHGQGYADMHFLIPETIEEIDYGKGPYYADKGNFTTAGYAAFTTKEQLDNSSISLEVGQFNTLRTVGLFDLDLGDAGHDAYAAIEYTSSDGPFESPQNFNRLNLMGKYTYDQGVDGKVSILASHFQSRWDASGQVPVRAVNSGLISRFGAIDDTEGGSTGRTNLALSHTKGLDENTFIVSNAYYSHYDFELFSNFTFFLNDPINRDQIKQSEARDIFGLNTEINRIAHVGDVELFLQSGFGFRYDDVDANELSNTTNRTQTLNTIQLGDIDELNAYGYFNFEADFGKFIINPGIRLDYFKFGYLNSLTTAYDYSSQAKLFASPKLNFIYNVNENTHVFVKTGIGFHSNDTRVIVEDQQDNIVPAAYGADIGGVFKISPRLIVNTALWYLVSEEEFVYVGDGGEIELSGKSQRRGFDVGVRAQVKDWLFINADVNYADPKSTEAASGEDYIPLAPTLTSTGGMNVRKGDFTGGIRGRYIQDRPANEDNSIVAEGYLVLDLNASYQYKSITVSLRVENLLDAEWNEAQFATESRLQNERTPIEELHFTPGTPIAIRGGVKYSF